MAWSSERCQRLVARPLRSNGETHPVSDEKDSDPHPRLSDEIIREAGGAPAMQEMLDAASRMAVDAARQEQAQRALTDDFLRSIRHSPEARTARASQSTADALKELLERTDFADQREQRMLFWTRVSAIAAIIAAVLAAISIIVAIALS